MFFIEFVQYTVQHKFFCKIPKVLMGYPGSICEVSDFDISDNFCRTFLKRVRIKEKLQVLVAW